MVKSDIIQATADDGKVKTLHDYILEECKRQGFKVYEFEQLIMALNRTSSARKDKIYDELF